MPAWLTHLPSSVRLLPVILVILLMAPAWLSWPFLPKDRRDALTGIVTDLIRGSFGVSEVSRRQTKSLRP